MADPLTLLAVHAHPDDESIATGGTLARYAAEGVRTVLVCCTHGEEGEIRDPALDPVEAGPRLGAIREQELRAAAAILGVAAADVRLLPYRDSGMAGTAANRRPDNFANADPREAAARVAAVIRATRPHVVVTYDPGGGYGHPDHKKAHRVTLDAVAQAGDDGDGGPGWAAPKLYYTVRCGRVGSPLRSARTSTRSTSASSPSPTIGSTRGSPWESTWGRSGRRCARTARSSPRTTRCSRCPQT